MKLYHLISLGCPKNLVDSEIFAAIMQRAGFQSTPDPAVAQVIIINTCGFILDAKQEAIDTILSAAEYKKDGKCEMLIATGCLVKRYFEDLKRDLPEIDHLIDLKDFEAFAGVFDIAFERERVQLTPEHYAYLRISDGCNNHCAYCAIPAIRGPLKSDEFGLVIERARDMAREGVKELIVTAQDTTQYGRDFDGSSHLIELLKEMEEIEGIEWIRLLYLHPAHLDDQLIDYICASRKICHYFEVPLQHVSDHLLRDMNRQVDQKRIRSIINRIRERAADAVIRTTFIVGHPGETQDDFDELLEFVEEIRFDRLGVFTYSEEEGTASALLPQKVDEDTAILRKDQMMGLQMEISKEIMHKYFHEEITVIIDDISPDNQFDFIGRSRYDCPEIDGQVYIYGQAQVGQIVQVKITDTWEYDLVGKVIIRENK